MDKVFKVGKNRVKKVEGVRNGGRGRELGERMGERGREWVRAVGNGRRAVGNGRREWGKGMGKNGE